MFIFIFWDKYNNNMDYSNIKNNAFHMQMFIDDVVNYNNSILLEVYGKLQQEVPKDPKQSTVSKLLQRAYEKVEEKLGIPDIIGIYKGLDKEYDLNPPPALIGDFSDIAERFRMTYLQMRTKLAQIYDKPEKYANEVYGDFQVGKMSTIHFPEYGTLDFNNLLVTFNNVFRMEITRDELVKRYKIGITEFISRPQVRLVNPVGGRDPEFNVKWWILEHGINTLIPERSFGMSKEETINKGNFDNTLIPFLERVPGVFLDRYDRPDGIAWQEYCMVGKWVEYGQYTWTLLSAADKATALRLSNWLFIDDGYGNIMNPNGVAYRRDVFTKWGIEGSNPPP